MAERPNPRATAALRQAAQLPPLPLAVVHLADAILREIVAETAETALHASATHIPCDVSVKPLLEGAVGTLPGDGARISTSLHNLLTEEVTQTARCAKRAREALGPSHAAGAGADIFGNRPKQSSAETVVCTNCGMPLAANRFAPHLERCLLGRGRQRRPVSSTTTQS